MKKKLLVLSALVFSLWMVSAQSAEIVSEEESALMEAESRKEEKVLEESGKSGVAEKDGKSEKTIIYETPGNMLKETEDSRNMGVSFFAKSVKLIQKIPFAIDVGLEGASNGTVTYLSAVYSWTDWFHTRFNFEYEHSLGYEKGTTARDEVQLYPLNMFTFQFFPIEHHIFFNKSQQSQFSYGIGMQYIYRAENTSITGWFSGSDLLGAESNSSDIFFYKYENETENNIFGPIARCYFRIPLTSFIVFNSETLMNPINGYFSESDAHYSMREKAGVILNDNSYNNFYWTYSDIKETVHFDFFNLFAAVFCFNFQHIDYDYYSLYNNLLPVNSTSVNQYVFKVGLSLINVGKTNVRLKSGVYYEHKWTKNNITNIQLYEGKWTVSLGLDF